MMVRILSILPGLIGIICGLIVILSLFGYETESGLEAPVVPCSSDDMGCNVGMTGEDLWVPKAFILLDIRMDVSWNEPERGWLGVVVSSAAEECPPDSNGLTPCSKEEIKQFLVAGGPQADGEMEFQIEPGKYRFVAGGNEGSGLDTQLVKMETSVHLNNYVEVALSGLSFLLLIGAGEMAFPIRNLFKRFRKG